MYDWYQKDFKLQDLILSDYDAVFTIGGDGTLIQASHTIFDSNKLVIGINQSPQTSAGVLCTINNEKKQIENLV